MVLFRNSLGGADFKFGSVVCGALAISPRLFLPPKAWPSSLVASAGRRSAKAQSFSFSSSTFTADGWLLKEGYTLTAKAPENRPGPKRKLVFQPSIFRCYVSFREGIRYNIQLSLSLSLSLNHSDMIVLFRVETLLLTCFLCQRHHTAISICLYTLRAFCM